LKLKQEEITMTSYQYGGMHAGQPTYIELIRRGARQHADRIALVFGEESLSFSEVDGLSSQLAHALYSQGIKQNDRVALLMNNGLLSVPLDFACAKAGLNRVPLNARLSLAEHVRCCRRQAAST
jgi:acyl-CoA synthetase (AMP-forming)/AMP-acid ligase II